jgi:hypothetical protein
MMRALVVVAVAGCTSSQAQNYDGVHLSTEGLYDDIAGGVIAHDAIEIRPQFALWSDGAEKQRWVQLPAGGRIDTTDMDHWLMPVGTKLYKEFRVGGQRVETRVIERVSESEYRFAPYAWLADGSDALLVPDGATDVLGTGHAIPGRDVCIACHQSEPGRALGVSALQLSDMLDELPLTVPTHERFTAPPALGVLHANCGHCHTDGGVASFQQLRFSIADARIPVEQTGPYRSIVGAPLEVWQQPPFQYRVVPGDPMASAIHFRMASTTPGERMPAIGSDVVDTEGLRLVDDWIRSL